jgi:heat-inducible transcriptional repressor
MTLLSTRQERLLDTIIAEYTTSAKPVSSGQLVDLDRLDVSPATVRNDMAALEEAGYLHQPHTSAGRIPTELAWRWFVKRVMPEHHVGKREREHLETVAHAHRDSEQEMMRKMAKALAEIIEEAVIIAFDKTDTYYTGLSNLFQQPEFEDINILQNLSKVVDHLDEVMARMYNHVGNDVSVLVGRDNPFSATCGTLLGRYSVARRSNGVIAFLGPMRQDYGEHMAILRFTQSLLQTV